MNEPLTQTRPASPTPSSRVPSSTVLEAHLRSQLRQWLAEHDVENVLMSAHHITVEFSDGHHEVHDLTTATSTPAQKADHDRC